MTALDDLATRTCRKHRYPYFQSRQTHPSSGGNLIPGSILLSLLFSFCFLSLLPAPSVPATNAATLGDEATHIALSVVGSAYSYYGASPRTGFSCIGLVHWVYKQMGIEVPINLQQAYDSFPKVSPNALQPGDVLFYQNTFWPGISHAAIYIGNNQMVTADSPANGVRIDPMTWPYWQQRWYGAVRPWGPVTLPPVPAGSPAASGSSVLVLADSLFVRTGPDRIYPDIAMVSHNEVFPLLATYNGWDKIALPAGRSGWVTAAWVTNGRGSPHVPTPLPAKQPTAGRIAQVVVDQLRVHTAPDQAAPLLGMAYKGDRFAVAAIQSGWVQIAWQGRLAWVAGLWVRLSAPGAAAPAPKAPPTSHVVTVAVAELRVRKGPGADQPIIGVAHQGKRLTAIGSQGGWLQIKWLTQTGWIMSNYVR